MYESSTVGSLLQGNLFYLVAQCNQTQCNFSVIFDKYSSEHEHKKFVAMLHG